MQWNYIYLEIVCTYSTTLISERLDILFNQSFLLSLVDCHCLFVFTLFIVNTPLNLCSVLHVYLNHLWIVIHCVHVNLYKVILTPWKLFMGYWNHILNEVNSLILYYFILPFLETKNMFLYISLNQLNLLKVIKTHKSLQLKKYNPVNTWCH